MRADRGLFPSGERIFPQGVFFFFFLGLGAVVRFVSFALQLCGIQYQRRLKEERGRLLFFGFGPGRRAAVEEELAGCAST
jgi:hypothetical protein